MYAIRSGLQSAVVSNMYGYSLLEEGAFEQALEQFQGVANESPGEANPWDSLGEGYLANGMPDKAFEAYSRALTLAPNFEHSLIGRGLALAASALLTSAWMLIEQQQFARALENVRAAETTLAGRTNHSLLMLADLMGGVAEIRAGNIGSATQRLAAQKSRYTNPVPVEANWMSALEGEIALAQGRYNEAVSSFTAAQQRGWMILGRDATTVFAINLPTRDGVARVEIRRGNRSDAIDEYRRLAVGAGRDSSAALEPRHILELGRLLGQNGDTAGARVEYERVLKLWANADSGLPELAEAKRALADATP